MISEIQCLNHHKNISILLKYEFVWEFSKVEFEYRSTTISLMFHHREVSNLQNILEMCHRRNVCYRKKSCVYFLIFRMRTVHCRKKSFENYHKIGSPLGRYLDVIPGKHWVLSTFYWDQLLINKYWHWRFSLKVGFYILFR